MLDTLTNENCTSPVEAFKALFDGYDKAHVVSNPRKQATKESGKVDWPTKTIRTAIPDSEWQRHFEGETSLHVIPLRDDDTVSFACLDFDERGHDLSEFARKCAKLPVTVCHSKSGAAHFYLFFAEPLPAVYVFTKLQTLQIVLGLYGSEIFPKQVRRIDDSACGNAIRLPYCGKHTFAYGNDGEQLTLEQFIDRASARRITRDFLDTLTAPHPDFEHKLKTKGGKSYKPTGTPPDARDFDNEHDTLKAHAIHLRRCEFVDDVTDGLLERNAQFAKPRDEREVRGLAKWVNKNIKADATRAEFAEFGATHALINVGNDARVIVEEIDGEGRLADYTIMSRDAFKALNGHRKHVVDAWFAHPKTRRYHKGFDYVPYPFAGKAWSPDIGVPLGYYNTWRGIVGSRIENSPSPTHVLAHIRERWCQNDEKIFDYVIKWMAWKLQRPGERPETAIFVGGGEGTGKGTIGDLFGSYFGKHFMHAHRQGDVTGRFNGYYGECSFTLFDEAFFAGNIAEANTLRGYVTDEKIIVEKKFENARAVTNTMAYMIFANELHGLHAASDSRRYVCLETAPKREGDAEYFKALHDAIKNGERDAFFNYLLDMSLGDFHPRRDPPVTAKLLQQRELSETPERAVIRHILERGINPGTHQKYPGYVDMLVTDNLRALASEVHPKGNYLTVKTFNNVATKIGLGEYKRNGGRIYRRNENTGEVEFKRRPAFKWVALDEARNLFDPNTDWGDATNWLAEIAADDEVRDDVPF